MWLDTWLQRPGALSWTPSISCWVTTHKHSQTETKTVLWLQLSVKLLGMLKTIEQADIPSCGLELSIVSLTFGCFFLWLISPLFLCHFHSCTYKTKPKKLCPVFRLTWLADKQTGAAGGLLRYVILALFKTIKQLRALKAEMFFYNNASVILDHGVPSSLQSWILCAIIVDEQTAGFQVMGHSMIEGLQNSLKVKSSLF